MFLAISLWHMVFLFIFNTDSKTKLKYDLFALMVEVLQQRIPWTEKQQTLVYVHICVQIFVCMLNVSIPFPTGP